MRVAPAGRFIRVRRDLAPTDPDVAYTATTIPDGDLNADGVLDAADGLLASRLVADPGFPPTAYHLDHGDVAPLGAAPSGQLDVADQLLILRGIAGHDVDGDGLDDRHEVTLGTSPYRSDTDGDGLSDQEEVEPPQGTPATDPTKRDSDGDGASDAEELLAGTDPSGLDLDLDGVPDGFDTDGDRIPDGRDATPHDRIVFHHGDHLGSTTVLTNHEGSELSRVLYKPFGAALLEATPANNAVPTFGFTGQRFEANLGLYDYGARWYDPALGRFLSPDPVVPEPFNPQTLNAYTYVRNDPLGRVDPSGRSSLSVSFWGGAEGWVRDPYFGTTSYGLGVGGTNLYLHPEFLRQRFDSFVPLFPWSDPADRATAGISVRSSPARPSGHGGDGLSYIPTHTSAGRMERGVVSTLNTALDVHRWVVQQQKNFFTGNFCNDPTINCGVADPPQVGRGGKFALDSLSDAARALDRNMLTKAGRALQKHANRAKSAFHSRSTRATDLNREAQEIVDDILTTPGSVQLQNRLGGVDVVSPNGRRLRYNADGTFRGFLEP